MSAVVTRITVKEYLDLLVQCWEESQGVEAHKEWHPEDIYVNLTVLMWPLTVGLSNGRKAIKLDDTFWQRPNGEDPL